MEKKYKYCFKEKKSIEIHSCEHEKIIENKENRVNEITFEGKNAKIVTNAGAVYKEFNHFLSNLPADLISLGLTRDKYLKVIGMIKKTTEQSINVFHKQLKMNGNDNPKTSVDYILNKFNEIDTLPKLKNVLSKSPFYVEPKETAIGLKWKKSKTNMKTNIPNHQLTNDTFSYVSVKDTLKTVFSHEEFRNVYIEYNLNKKHKCTADIFQDFCCGSVYKSKEIFEDRLTLQLQLATDDVELCCPLKSNTGKHKLNATYLQIKNMPPEYKSKLDGIYLVALCNSSKLKSNNFTYDHVAELIVNEIRDLEENGIQIGDHTVKATLINIACDNLGASTVFGFTECFVANYFCRHCECDKHECQRLVEEDKSKMRTVAKHQKHVERAENKHSKLDLKVTKGVKRSCKFDDLENFNVIENMPVDVMHDVNEGVISYCLHDFFNIIIDKKIVSAAEIQRRVRDFIYSPVHAKNKPSLINFDKSSLNQNASQMYCLAVNLPFILFDLKEKVQEYWMPVETLLKCMQIIFSPVITEADRKSLKIHIKHHLQSVISVFKRTLTPKHHFLLHYPESIQKLGPPIHLWTMRFEAKHKIFTEIAKVRKNFKNITKTLAVEHQERMCGFSDLSCTFKASALSSQFSKSNQFLKYKDILRETFQADLDSIRVHRFAKYGSIDYRGGGLFILEDTVYEIIHVLSIESKIHFLCQQHNIICHDEFLNSLMIEKQDGFTVIFKENNLQNVLVFNKYFIANNHFIIAENLQIAKLVK